MDRFNRPRGNVSIIGEIRAAMARRDVRPVAVAAAIGMNRSSIYRRLNGDTPFTLDEILAIAAYLDVPAGSFFEREMAA